MIRPEDARLQKMLEAFDTLNLNSDELEIIESYLRGEAEGEVLQELTFRSLETAGGEATRKFHEIVNSLLNKNRYAEAGKVFNVAFQLGESTAATILPLNPNSNVLRNKDTREQMGVELAKLIAMYVQSMGNNAWQYNTYNMINLAELAEQDTESMRKALAYCKSSMANAKVLLLTVYFWKKYPNGLQKGGMAESAQVQEASQNGGIKGAISQLFGSKENASTANTEASDAQNGVLPEDAELLALYENIIANNIDRVFTGTTGAKGVILPKDLIKKIQDAVTQKAVTDSLLAEIRKAGKASMSDNLLKLLGGCSFVNYMLSDVLKGAVTVFAAANGPEVLDVVVQLDCRKLLSSHGGELDRMFKFPPAEIIEWAAERGFRRQATWSYGADSDMSEKVLRGQFANNREAYLEYQKKASFDASNRMMDVIKEMDSNLYKNMLSSGAGEQKEKVIGVMVSSISLRDECIAFLRGESQLADLYAIEGSIAKGKHYYGGFNEWNALESYHKNYQDEEFFKRCILLMALCQEGYFFRHSFYDKDARGGRSAFNRKTAEKIFRCMNAGGLDVAHQLSVLNTIFDVIYGDTDVKMLQNALQYLFLEYMKERPEETLQAFKDAEAQGRYFAICVLEQEADAYKEQILSFSQDTAKVVKEKLEEILKGKQEWRAEVMALLASKKAAQRELGIRVMLHWNTPEDLEALGKLLETEKNAKVRNLLESTLQTDAGGEGAPAGAKVLTCEELVTNLHKGGKKRSLAWAYETPFSQVHKKNGELATEEYVQAILLCYTGMNTPGISKDAKLLAEALNEAELAILVNELFDKWLEAGAEAKKRWVMYASSIHGGSDIVKKLHHQIQEWPNHARGAIAADAVQALALNPQPQALLIVDGIARKFKFKQVKAAAGKALEFAAAQLGLTREELEDKIVPDLGFDENMERHFDYGERSFTVTITPALEIAVFDESGKKLKNLPAPGKKDDEEKANAAYAEFKEMKKQMKTTISSQKMRLELALSAERLWSVEAWQDLFVKNPVMHQFAIGLIWGVYEEHKLTQTFRYMEDGSFNTEDEDEYTLPEQGYIGLVHPIELSQESRDAWKQQLEDYEITQPIEQLGRAIYYRTEDEESMKTLERFGGVILNSMSLNGKLQQLGWYRGSVQDAGGFDTFYREDSSLGLGVELHFSGAYVAAYDGGEDVTVYDARFYKAGTITRGSYMYEEADEQKQIPLKQIPERYFSEIVLQLTKATASSQEKDEDWKKNK